MSTSPGNAPSVTYIHTQEFLPAEIKTMFTDSPITLVTAPGKHKAILPISVALDYTFVTYPYFSASGSGTICALKIGGNALDSSVLTGGVLAFRDSFSIADSNISSAHSPLSELSSQLQTFTFQPYNSAFSSGTNPRSAFENLPFVLTAANANMTNGTPLTFSINTAGSGYAIGDTLSDDSAWGNGDFLVTVNTVSGGGAVLTYTVTSVGTSGWHAVPPSDASSVITFSNVPPQSGSGTGFALNVTSIGQGDGTLRLTVQYQVLTLG